MHTIYIYINNFNIYIYIYIYFSYISIYVVHLFVLIILSSLVLKHSSDMRLLTVGLHFSRFNFVCIFNNNNNNNNNNSHYESSVTHSLVEALSQIRAHRTTG